MDNKFRLFLVFFFIFSGIYFFYQHFTVPRDKTGYWKYKIRENQFSPSFLCKARTLYTFKSKYGFLYVSVNGVFFNLSDIFFLNRSLQSFSITFPEETEVRLYCGVKGKRYKTGGLKIWEKGGEVSKNCPLLVLIVPDKESYYTFQVKKGMGIYTPPQKLDWQMLLFKDNKSVNLNGMKVKMRREKGYLGGNQCGLYWRFWDDYEVKFKAQNRPKLLEFVSMPEMEKLRVSYGNSSGAFEEKRGEKAYFLEPGEVIETPFWVDKGDAIIIGQGDNYKGFDCATEGKKWKKPVWGRGKDTFCRFEAEAAGYLKIKANSLCALNNFTIFHAQKWSLDLKSDQVQKIQIWPNDVIRSYSSSWYYVDGQRCEANTTNIHQGNGKSNYLEFKGSFATGPIKVWVTSRRGY